MLFDLLKAAGVGKVRLEPTSNATATQGLPRFNSAVDTYEVMPSCPGFPFVGCRVPAVTAFVCVSCILPLLAATLQ